MPRVRYCIAWLMREKPAWMSKLRALLVDRPSTEQEAEVFLKELWSDLQVKRLRSALEGV